MDKLVDFSYAMLVSRFDDKFMRSLRSVARQRPTSFKAYLDSVKLGESYDKVADYVTMYGGEPVKQFNNPSMTHHENVVNNVHRALLEADYKWVRWGDDDDESLTDTSGLIMKHGASDVGVIYGDTLAFHEKRLPYIRRSKQVYLPMHCNWASIGSGQIYNRDAFKEIHGMVDHGYWWDMKIIYWMMRAGYRAVYVPYLTSIQNVNTMPSPERVEARTLGWRHELETLENTDL